MKVEVIYRSDPERPLTDPVLESGDESLFFVYTKVMSVIP